MNESYLSLGSNIGDRLEMLKRAVGLLANHPEIKVEKISSLYETEPVGYTDQDSFLNMIVFLRTDLSALLLLDVCQEIEEKLARRRVIRWGPRTIDLDILLYNQDEIETERLVVPHPRMYERAFVLIPLLELNPALAELDAPEKEGVRLWKRYSSVDSFLQNE